MSPKHEAQTDTIVQVMPAPPGWRVVYADIEPPSWRRLLVAALTVRAAHVHTEPVAALALVEYDDDGDTWREVVALVQSDATSAGYELAGTLSNFIGLAAPGERIGRWWEERALQKLAELHVQDRTAWGQQELAHV